MFEYRNIKYLYLKLNKKIKDFLLSEKSREFLVFLFFFVIAASFWLLQTLNNDYETNFSVPLKLKGLPENVTLTADLPSEVNIKVRDKGTVLLNYMLTKNFFPILINFSDNTGVNNRVKIYASDFEKQIFSQLNASTRLLSVKPDTLEYIYSMGEAKRVPVRLMGQVVAERQYYISDTLFSPDSVLVYAPKEILKTITSAYTERLEVKHIADTVSCHPSLSKIRGAKFVPSSVNLLLPVDIYTEKTLEIPIYGVNFPADKILRTFPSKVQLTFQVGLKDFHRLKPDDFALNVSYKELMHLGADKYTVKLKKLPPGVSNVRISPKQVDFLIEEYYPL